MAAMPSSAVAIGTANTATVSRSGTKRCRVWDGTQWLSVPVKIYDPGSSQWIESQAVKFYDPFARQWKSFTS